MVLKELLADFLAESYYRMRWLAGYTAGKSWSTAAWHAAHNNIGEPRVRSIWFLWYYDRSGQLIQRYPEQWNP